LYFSLDPRTRQGQAPHKAGAGEKYQKINTFIRTFVSRQKYEEIIKAGLKWLNSPFYKGGERGILYKDTYK
jgi:hypothetical protein